MSCKKSTNISRIISVLINANITHSRAHKKFDTPLHTSFSIYSICQALFTNVKVDMPYRTFCKLKLDGIADYINTQCISGPLKSVLCAYRKSSVTMYPHL